MGSDESIGYKTFAFVRIKNNSFEIDYQAIRL